MNRASETKTLSPRAAAFREKTLSGAKALAHEDLRLSNCVSESVGKFKAKRPLVPR